MWIFFVVFVSSVSSLWSGLRLVHIYQLEGYRMDGCWRWLKRNASTALDLMLQSTALLIAILCYAVLLRDYPVKYLGVLFYPAFVLLFQILESKPKRVPLRYTKRVCRFLAVHLLVCVGVCYLAALIGSYIDISYSLVGLMPVANLATIPLAHLVVLPIELGIQRGYKRRAIAKLAQHPRLITVGITGSYGKTSVKNFLAQMLKTRYSVCASPASYNTPMGLCKVINSLQNEEVLIAEMGARRRGDIAELVRMIPLDIAVITAIEKQHLETFKTLENIAQTKYEIMGGLKEGGVGVFNGVCEPCRGLFELFTHRKILVASRPAQSGKTAYFEGVSASKNGTSFDLVLKGGRVSCETKLLGVHNVENITIAAAVAFELGVGLEDIAHAISELSPVPHRLQLVDNSAGINIIDDAYNSNPQGARAALRVLKMFPHSRVVVTAGLVELGEDGELENRILGEELADVADWCVLVGGNSHTIKSGLESAGYQKKISVVDGLHDAQRLIAGRLNRGDTVLFLNDLPDNY